MADACVRSNFVEKQNIHPQRILCHSGESDADVCQRGWQVVMYEMYAHSSARNACRDQWEQSIKDRGMWKDEHDDSSL